MEVEEVKNEEFFQEDIQVKKRKRVKIKRTEEEHKEDIPVKSVPISEYIINSTNAGHRIYREFLIARKNGERVGSMNPFR